MLMPYERFEKDGKTYEVRGNPFSLGGFTFLTVWDISKPRGTYEEMKFPYAAFVKLDGMGDVGTDSG